MNSHRYPDTKAFLKAVNEILNDIEIEYLFYYSKEEAIFEAIADIRYAASLSSIAVQEHLEHWSGHVALNMYEAAYISALNEIQTRISDMLIFEEWSSYE